MFVTFEGIDGAGKSTQVRLLRDFLVSRGRRVIVEREPGGTPIGEQIRAMLLEGEAMAPWTEASLFAAARAELVATVIKPALADGQDVVLDRYVDSSFAYQGFARGLDLAAIRMWNAAVTQDLRPDHTFLLSFPAEDTPARLGRQLCLAPARPQVGPPDRIERESLEFRRRVEEGYRVLADDEPGRFVRIDGGLAKQEIAGRIQEVVVGSLECVPLSAA